MKSGSWRNEARHQSRRLSLVGFCRAGPLLNISSMRSVTRKPPTTLIVPKAIAITSSSSLRNPVGLADQQQAAEQHDAVDRVGGGHERRVQRVRHLRDDLEADEGGEHEDGQLGEQVHLRGHLRGAALAPSCTISPSWVMQAPSMISSSKSSSARPRRRPSARAATGRCGHRAGRRGLASSRAGSVGPAIVTPSLHDRLARLGQLAVAAGLGRQVDDHRARASCS